MRPRRAQEILLDAEGDAETVADSVRKYLLDVCPGFAPAECARVIERIIGGRRPIVEIAREMMLGLAPDVRVVVVVE